ncbi:MAG: hypothetical protein VYB87_05975 [Acidobacteriota bacterium]|nr:hypothetical protein [Acidobacteriota bacterium]
MAINIPVAASAREPFFYRFFWHAVQVTFTTQDPFLESGQPKDRMDLAGQFFGDGYFWLSHSDSGYFVANLHGHMGAHRDQPIFCCRLYGSLGNLLPSYSLED